MKYSTTPRFDRSFKKLPRGVEIIFEKQVTLLLRNIRHPSLHAKKYDETTGLWQARVNYHVRFYFTIDSDTYTLVDIKKHKD